MYLICLNSVNIIQYKCQENRYSQYFICPKNKVDDYNVSKTIIESIGLTDGSPVYDFTDNVPTLKLFLYKAFGEAVIELKKKHAIPYEHRLRYTLDITFWKKICLIERSRFLDTKKCHRGRGVCVDSSRSSCSRRFLEHKCPGSHHIKCCTGHTTVKTSTKGNE